MIVYKSIYLVKLETQYYYFSKKKSLMYILDDIFQRYPNTDLIYMPTFEPSLPVAVLLTPKVIAAYITSSMNW